MSKFLIALVIISLVTSVIYKKWAVNYALKQLYQLRAQGDSKQFIRAVDSDYIKFHFSPFSRAIMKLNYWIDKGESEEVEALLPTLKSLKSTPKDQIALYVRLLGYALDQRQYQRAEDCLAKLQELLRDRRDRESIAVKREIQQVDRVYFKKDAALIPELEQALEQAQGENASVLCYRLSKLYHAKGDTAETERYLDQAFRRTQHGPSRKVLEAAMGNHSLLD